MKHRTEEELIAYRDGDAQERGAIAEHLKECVECRSELERIEMVYAAMDAMPVPDAGPGYEQRVWQRIARRLEEKNEHWWAALFVPRRLAAVGAMAVLLLLAFYLGRRTGPTVVPSVKTADAAKVRERVLVVAVGEHLGRTEMVLMELENAAPQVGRKAINIAATQRRAEDLVEENRLYRQTALSDGDQAVASTLDELERVLLDIANSPKEMSPAEFETIRKRIEGQGLLFKVRVVKQGLDERKASPEAKPAENASGTTERKKT